MQINKKKNKAEKWFDVCAHIYSHREPKRAAMDSIMKWTPQTRNAKKHLEGLIRS